MLSAEEVIRLLKAVPSLKSRAALSAAHATGLRVTEVIGLRMRDIDSGRMMIRIVRARRQ
ncbi:MAG: tyrosine-type recombinase/integrase [Pseudomonadota bacterium]